MTDVNIEGVIKKLAGSPALSAYISNQGVFLRKGGRVVARVAGHPPVDRLPRGSVNEEMVERELEKNAGACDISFPWRGHQVTAAVRRVGGDMAVELRVYPQAPPGVEDLGLNPSTFQAMTDAGGVVLVAGGRGVGRTTTAMAICGGLAEGRFLLTLEDPVTYRLPPPEKGIVAQREVGLYGDVPTFAEGLAQAAPQRPDVLYLSEAPDEESARRLPELAWAGTLVVLEAFGLDPEDAIRRVLVKGESGLAGDTSPGWRRSLLQTLKAVVFCPPPPDGDPGPPRPFLVDGPDLERLKNRWSAALGII